MNESALDPAGVGALHTASLWWVFFWVSTVVFALVAVLLGIAIWRRRPASAPEIDAAPRDKTTVWRFLFSTISVIAVTLIGLLIADFFTARTVLATGAPADPDALPIHVTGHQWWWEVHYPATPPSEHGDYGE